jgi:hypothetical protein
VVENDYKHSHLSEKKLLFQNRKRRRKKKEEKRKPRDLYNSQGPPSDGERLRSTYTTATHT